MLQSAIDIRPLARNADLGSAGFVFTGYESDRMYESGKTETDDHVAINLRLVPRPGFVKRWSDKPADRARRAEVIGQGLSHGAYLDGKIVGVVLMENLAWNNSLHIEDIEVSPEHRGHGIGRMLLKKAVESAGTMKARVITLETQNTNYPAIRFYRKNGFEIDCIDLSLYTNEDAERGEVAIIMKRKLPQRDSG
jgi:ribosomal protein S18 acetylase RimI-like enzyme